VPLLVGEGMRSTRENLSILRGELPERVLCLVLGDSRLGKQAVGKEGALWAFLLKKRRREVTGVDLRETRRREQF